MKTKITIKDIAREAGVSIATVSYVLNNKTEERISEETRKKVLQIINLLNYTPNKSAKALASNKNGNIAVYLPASVSPLKQAEQLHFLHTFANVLKSYDYHLTLLSPADFSQVDNSDAIICYDVSKEEFSKLGNNNFIPLLAVDCIIDDPLFFQVLFDYEKLLSETNTYFAGEEFIFASLEVVNVQLKSMLEKLFPHIVFLQSVKDFKALYGKNVLVTEDTLYQLLKEDCNIYYQPSATNNKIQKLYECMELAMGRVQITSHNILV
ncbi:LacI family DNA-binding transcriptional regulator [Lachnoclostridium phytofermentans]|uniref:LacI family DNA-binding transcriptional regulator n=1 Tax=Lachnoclostridium phytofermentans TaxID=66219 RepID=UPI000496970F|nr:LacI family DNA-binding transcriptional regulator [Lachnoclostridium phytofermentans]